MTFFPRKSSFSVSYTVFRGQTVNNSICGVWAPEKEENPRRSVQSGFRGQWIWSVGTGRREREMPNKKRVKNETFESNFPACQSLHFICSPKPKGK